MKKTIFITGGTGFLGKVVSQMLQKADYEVVAISRNETQASTLKTIFEEKKPFGIIHTATTYGNKGESLSDIMESNLALPLRLLELGISHHTTLFLNADTFVMREQPGPRLWYVATKKDFLVYARELVKGSSTQLINLKIEHMYGPDDNPTKFLPFLITKLLENKERVPLINGEQKRDFIYVDDVARAFLLSLQHISELHQWEEFGIGSGTALPFRTVIEMIAKEVGSSSVLGWGDYPYHPQDSMFSQADVLANKKINWKPEISLEKGLEKTVEFYRKRFKKS